MAVSPLPCSTFAIPCQAEIIRPSCLCFEDYHARLELKEPKLKWITQISSPYILQCQYHPLDDELFLEALHDYLKIWIEHYYKPAKRLESDNDIETVTYTVHNYKQVLHANDPAYKNFSRDWGKMVADAFLYLETRDQPDLHEPAARNAEDSIPPWKNDKLNILWTAEAQSRVMEAPQEVHQIIRDAVEKNAASASVKVITLDAFDRFKEAPPVG